MNRLRYSNPLVVDGKSNNHRGGDEYHIITFSSSLLHVSFAIANIVTIIKATNCILTTSTTYYILLLPLDTPAHSSLVKV